MSIYVLNFTFDQEICFSHLFILPSILFSSSTGDVSAFME